MYFAEVLFPFANPKARPSVVLDRTYSLTAAWIHNGQMYKTSGSVLSGKDNIRWYVLLPERTSLSKKWNNQYAVKAAEELAKVGAGAHQVRILGREASLPPVCRCRKPSRYYLFTTFIDITSPLNCGDCRRPVPLYRIPKISGDDYFGILGWQDDYRACDTLWMGSGVGERFNWRQMSEAESELSRAGRKICAAIEEKTGIPTYFYLDRYSGRSLKSEKARKCPVCKGEWLLAERWGIFDFQCDGCRLLSNLAVNFPR
jgi:predicted  nucleic acid-binding Zn ribbon protein